MSSSCSRSSSLGRRMNLRYSCSLRVNSALIGSTVETVVTGAPVGLTRLPICTCALPAIPAIGEVRCVNPRLTRAASTAACAASTAASAAWICAFAVSICFCSIYLCLGGEIVLHRVVEILLRNGLLLRQWDIAIDIELRTTLVGLRLQELRLSLNELRFRLPELS